MIASDLAAKIKHKQYLPGDLLPGETTLADLYGTSRGTIRKALERLTDLGMIQKVQGKGSVVLDLSRYTFPISGLTSFKELNDSLGMQAQTEVLVNETAEPPVTFLGQPVEAKQAVHLTRLRRVAGRPVVVDDDYLLTPPIHELSQQVAQTSIYQYFEQVLGLKIAYAKKEITVRPAGDQITTWLDLPCQSLVVAVRSLVYLEDTTLFQLTTSYHRPDKFRFQDFARRQVLG